MRDTVVITWLIATPIFALYPVAPPRLLGIGVQDIVSHQAVVTLTGQSTLFYNPYAALPSLHVGLAFFYAATGLLVAGVAFVAGRVVDRGHVNLQIPAMSLNASRSGC